MAERRLVLLDSIGHVSDEHAGSVIVSGSHGGTAAADYILRLSRDPYAAFFNDAGGGKDHAGMAGLPMLQARGIIAATYAHTSARIGDAADGLATGVITQVNALAAQAGVSVASPVSEAVRVLSAQ